MIARIRLTNWRAYERLDLPLDKPVTFVVAPNGVGKTSLVEAVKWGMFGTASGQDLGRAVRVGAQEATVGITLFVAGSTLDVTRSLTASGESNFWGSRDGTEITESEYLELIRSSWAADPELLVSLLFGEAGTQASSAFPIKEHLAEVFGVSPLREGVATIDERLRSLNRDIKNLRAEHGDDAAGIKQAEEDAERLRADVRPAEERVEAAKMAAWELRQEERAAAAWQEYRESLTEYEQTMASLVEHLRGVVDVGEGDAEALIVQAEEEAEEEVDQHRAAVSEAESRAAWAGSALDLLGSEIHVCPTCLRPLLEEERVRALQDHHAEQGDASKSLQAHREALQAAEARLKRVREIRRSMRDIRVPAPPEVPEPEADVADRLRQAEQEWAAATEAHGAAVARLNDAQKRLDALRQSAQENAALVSAYREEAVLKITKDTLHNLADRYMRERIEPLADEVGRRWKLLFGSGGLDLDHDGSLSRELGGEHLKLSDFSGGERVVALFVTRLLVVASATYATTMWLDEPLEHLDPARRAATARTLVRAVQQGTLEQVVVTTYEEHLARQLAATAPDAVDIAHVRATPAG